MNYFMKWIVNIKYLIKKEVSQVISKIYNHLQARIQSLSESVIISADIWSKPGVTASFPGVTAHFFTPDSNKRHSICIALTRFPSPEDSIITSKDCC